MAATNDFHSPGKDTVLVLGGSGYVGGRLIPELLDAGADVRCMTRSPERLRSVDWASRVDVVGGDLLDPDSLDEAFAGADQVVYLVHSLDDGDDFEERELRSARHAREAAEHAGVRRFVYLSGLGDDADELSPHLRSRHAVGAELAAGVVEVVELRAAVVLGAGSASFEMLRSLVEVLPIMIAPTWVTRTTVQPIAIADVLAYLLAACAAPADPGRHRVVEIGGPESMTYRQLIDEYAAAAGLRRRIVIPVPVVTPRLSSHWVNVVTPLPRSLSRQLIDSLRHDVVVTDDSAASLADVRPLDARRAIEAALGALDDLDVPTRWSGVSAPLDAARSRPWDPDWSGDTVYEDVRVVDTDRSAEAVMRTVRGIGGDRGWYGFGALWAIRGAADKLVGGVGLRRGRRHPDEIHVGEALDFWRVDALDDDLFRLRAEMKLPGRAWLEWSTESPAPTSGRTDDETPATRVTQRARFVPTGLWGRVYWWLLVPFHGAIFPLMLRRIVGVSGSDPEADDLTDAA